jgi:hypothetical protein
LIAKVPKAPPSKVKATNSEDEKSRRDWLMGGKTTILNVCGDKRYACKSGGISEQLTWVNLIVFSKERQSMKVATDWMLNYIFRKVTHLRLGQTADRISTVDHWTEVWRFLTLGLGPSDFGVND